MERRRLQKERDVSLNFLSCNELPHFVGHDLEAESDTIPVSVDYDNVPFHCEICFYQEDDHTNVTLRHIGARLKDGEIVDWETTGIPDEMEDKFRGRVRVTYHVLYPDGLTMEDMEMET